MTAAAPDDFDSPDGQTYSGPAPGIEVTHEPEIPVFLVQLWLCDPCLDGVGEQCHTPGCSLWIHDAPKPAIRGSQGVTILGPALEPFMTRERYAEHVAAQQPGPELAAVTADRDRLLSLLARYERITTAWTRGMYCAWIDCVRGDVKAAIECLAEGLDGYDGPEWDRTETGAQWWERTKAEEGL